MIQGKMLVLPNPLLYCVLSTSDQYCVSFQTILCHPHTQIRIILCNDVQRDIPNLGYSPSHVSIGFLKLPFPLQSCQRMTVQIPLSRRTTGSSILDHDFGHLCRVDESKRLDTPILEFSIICVHLPYLLGCTPILRLLLVHRNLAIWR